MEMNTELERKVTQMYLCLKLAQKHYEYTRNLEQGNYYFRIAKEYLEDIEQRVDGHVRGIRLERNRVQRDSKANRERGRQDRIRQHTGKD
jgi:hypothetical protein